MVKKVVPDGQKGSLDVDQRETLSRKGKQNQQNIIHMPPRYPNHKSDKGFQEFFYTTYGSYLFIGKGLTLGLTYL